MAPGQASAAAPMTAALLAVLLAGCSGTPLGERLAGSFSAAPAPQAPPATPAQPPAAGQPADAGQSSTQARTNAEAGDKGRAKADARADDKAAARADDKAVDNAPTKAGRALPLPTAPYRITIKLPSADPSAPAELVTEALRQAGVPFEVEMIERVNNGATPATPTPAPRPR